MGVIDEMREIGDLIKKAGDIELYRKITNLEGEVIDLTRGKRHAEERIEDLERKLKFQGELVFRKPFYYQGDDTDPYCPGCWDSKRQAVHVSRSPVDIGMIMCPACKHAYRAR